MATKTVEELDKEEGDFKLAVIGSPGHGKSTFLSAMVSESQQADDERYKFETAPTLDSCTKEVKARTVDFNLKPKIGDRVEVDDDGEWKPGTIEYVYVTGNYDIRFDDGDLDEDVDKANTRNVGGKNDTVKLTIVDTMGFPDPNPKDTVKFYNDVVKYAVNRPGGLHCLVWVLKQDRENEKIYKQYTAFMNELGGAKCKLIMIINGTENPVQKHRAAVKKLKTEKEKREFMDEKRKEIKGTLTQTADKLITALKFTQPVDAIVSTDLEVFEGSTVHELVSMVKTCELHTSKVRTFTELQADFHNAAKSLENYKKDLRERIGGVQGQLNAEKARRETVKAEFDKKMREATEAHKAEVEQWKRDLDAKSPWFSRFIYFVAGYPEENMPQLDKPVQQMSDDELNTKIAEADRKLAQITTAGKEQEAIYQKEADKKREDVTRLAEALNVSSAEGYKPS